MKYILVIIALGFFGCSQEAHAPTQPTNDELVTHQLLIENRRLRIKSIILRAIESYSRDALDRAIIIAGHSYSDKRRDSLWYYSGYCEALRHLSNFVRTDTTFENEINEDLK